MTHDELKRNYMHVSNSMDSATKCLIGDDLHDYFHKLYFRERVELGVNGCADLICDALARMGVTITKKPTKTESKLFYAGWQPDNASFKYDFTAKIKFDDGLPDCDKPLLKIWGTKKQREG